VECVLDAGATQQVVHVPFDKPLAFVFIPRFGGAGARVIDSSRRNVGWMYRFAFSPFPTRVLERFFFRIAIRRISALKLVLPPTLSQRF